MFTFLWCAVFCKGLPKEEPVASPAVVATVVEFTGNVQLRADARQSWRYLGSAHVLFAGDRIFTGKDSAVKIKYTNLKDTFITLGELTILQLASTPPNSSHLWKGIPAMQGELSLPAQASEPVPDLPFMDLLKPADKASSKAAREGGPRVSNLRVEYPITFLEPAAPKSNVYFQGSQLPRSVNIRFENTVTTKTPLFGTLWEIEPQRRPIWSSVFRENTLEVPIQKNGLFVFSAASADGRLRLKPTLIRSEAEAPELIPKSVRPHDVVVLQ